MSSHSETSSISISRAATRASAADCLKLAGYQGMATVLVVDDEPKLLEVRRLMLEALGYVVLVAESGEKALEIMRTRIVDAVILDYLMPGMDGEATARGIRALNLATPIILSTACLSVPERVLRLVTAFVPKGMAPTCLMEVLKEELQRANAGSTREIAQPCPAD
jgi:CheY-like chemotaxis protein